MKFTKMQATGNDFIVIDAREINYNWSTLAIDMCDRHFGIGADGIITIQNDHNKGLMMRIFNADGSEAEMCGNGLRCFAKYVVDHKILNGPEISINTQAGDKETIVFKSDRLVNSVRINMGNPKFKSDEIPVKMNQKEKTYAHMKYITDFPLLIDNKRILLSFVSMGNPHAISFTSATVSKFDLSNIGPKIETNRIFPERTNFEIARIVDKHTIEARVWERGVGETMACGTGACAIAVIAKIKGYYDKQVDIIMPGGNLEISWDGVGDVYLTGAAEEVFAGEWNKNTY